MTLLRTGKPNRAGALVSQATKLAEQTLDVRIKARVWLVRAQVAVMTSDLQKARELCLKARSYASQTDDVALEAQALIIEAGIAQGLADWASGELAANRARELLRGGENPGILGRAFLYSGDFVWQLGDRPRAEEHYRAAVKTFVDSSNAPAEASGRDHLGGLLANMRRFDEARVEHERASEIFSQIGDPIGLGSAMTNLATVLEAQGEPEEAHARRQLAVRNFRAAGASYMEGVGLGNLAHGELSLGLLERSSVSFQRTCDLLRNAGRVVEVGIFESGFARLLLLLGFTEAALTNARQASHALEKVDALVWLAQYVTPVKIKIAAVLGDVREADELLAEMKLQLERVKPAGGGLEEAVAKSEAVVAEMRKDGSVLFRGHLPGELSPPLRLALMDRMQKLEPKEWLALRTRPSLLAAMTDGTQGMEVPVWESLDEDV